MKIAPSRRALIATLIGESLREVAVLVFVFAPLDVLTQGIPLTGRVWATIIVGGAVTFALGVYLETKGS